MSMSESFFQVGAFVFCRPSTTRTVASLHHQPASPTALKIAATNPITGAALSFFSEWTTPATLIAGSSFVALFELTQKANRVPKLTQLETFLLRSYHVLMLACFCLSILTILTSAAVRTELLLGTFDGTLSTQVQQFLTTDVKYEFTLVLWSFSMSLIFFLLGIANRTILAFDLLQPGRRKGSLLIVSSMLGMATYMISYSNSRLSFVPHLGVLTVQVLQLVFQRAMDSRGPLQIASILAFLVATLSALWVVLDDGSIVNSDDDDGTEEKKD